MDWLILVPTSLEAEHLSADFQAKARIEICGFGPIAAAANTARLIDLHKPERILLLGIAGGYQEQIEIGKAYQFKHVLCYGVGVGIGDEFQSTAKMGWSHYQDADCKITDIIDLSICTRFPQTVQDCLISTCSASANDVEAKQKSASGQAEDMEGFGVATAAKIANIPRFIVRGISNTAGDRDHQRWKIGAAMRSAEQLAINILDNQS